MPTLHKPPPQAFRSIHDNLTMRCRASLVLFGSGGNRPRRGPLTLLMSELPFHRGLPLPHPAYVRKARVPPLGLFVRSERVTDVGRRPQRVPRATHEKMSWAFELAALRR